MQVVASLNNLRMSPRKVRLVTNLVKGFGANQAKSQLKFANKKAAGIVLKLIDSGLANAKNNFNLAEDNLYIEDLRVESGPSLKRWMPRAMGRATPILKRTCNINLILKEISAPAKGSKPIPSALKKKTPPKELEAKEPPLVQKEETISAMPQEREETEIKARPMAPPRPYRASGEAKKRFFSRQTFGNIRKVFRRKSI